jgi:hypothetical protein
MAIKFGKTLALVAVSGMVAGLAACGGSTPAPESADKPAAEGAKASCGGKGEGKSCGGKGEGKSCGGAKEEGKSCGGAKEGAPADAPK